ncbi:hypothetical protein [Sphingobacterium zeae]
MKAKKVIQFMAIAASMVAVTFCNNVKKQASAEAILLHNATLIDGSGGQPQQNTDILLQGDSIADIGKNLDTANVKVIDLAGKTVLPALISDHVHIGSLKGTTNKAENYTRDNILAQLNKYQDYGVLNILVAGSDRPMLFESGIRPQADKNIAKAPLPSADPFLGNNGGLIKLWKQ